MTRDQFWELIEKNKPKRWTCEKHCKRLRSHLEKMDIEEIISFNTNLFLLSSESYRADLWSVVYIVQGGCSDDGFDYFRGWLICQGKKVFETVLSSPDRIGEFISPGASISCEAILSLAGEIYHFKTGNWRVPYDGPRGPLKLKGKLLSEETMRRRYPALWKRFMENDE
jgi:hypothetical protein